MSARELTVLGTSSAVPTPRRNHNGYFLRWDGHGILFDPGEGTQRQMRRAGISAHDLTRICITHMHGDHCLGLPGVLQRLARDGAPGPVPVSFPASGEPYWQRLSRATPFAGPGAATARPLTGDAPLLAEEAAFTLSARPLRHRIDVYGYRLAEPDGWRMLPERLAEHGVTGPDIGRLQRFGSVDTAHGRVELPECAVPRRGQVFAFVMDTVSCPEAVHLAQGADLLVIESTFLQRDAEAAARYRHLTAEQAGRIAAEAGVRTLVLTHISERYTAADDSSFLAEAARHFTGHIRLAADFDRIALPPRRT